MKQFVRVGSFMSPKGSHVEGWTSVVGVIGGWGGGGGEWALWRFQLMLMVLVRETESYYQRLVSLLNKHLTKSDSKSYTDSPAGRTEIP